MLLERVIKARDEAKQRAFDSLARYKFEMFGYWASAWVKYNNLLSQGHRSNENPFRELVVFARELGYGPGKSRQKEV